MSTPAYIGRELYLQTLVNCTRAKYEQLIHVADNDTIRSIVEILLNVYKGDIHLDQSELDLFAQYRSVIKTIVANKTHYKEKKVLLKSHPLIVQKAVKVLLRAI
jgi:hypothetical protein